MEIISNNKTEANTVEVEIKVSPDAERIRLLEPFPAWDGKDFVDWLRGPYEDLDPH